MKNTITKIFYVVIILVVGICIHLVGCEKKVIGDKYGGVEGFVKDSQSLTPNSWSQCLLGRQSLSTNRFHWILQGLYTSWG